MSTKLLDLVNITKSYDGVTILDDLNLYIRENEFLTLLGPSGCGKTTTLRILGGFETPDAGKVLFNGQDITQLPPNKRQLNTVFQKYALFTHMTIAENIAFGLKIKGKSKAYIDDKIKYALKLVNLEGYENRSPALLSGGQQQRIAIARAIVNEPKVLLLDEPLGALDLKLRQDMQYELIRLKNELGITFATGTPISNSMTELYTNMRYLQYGTLKRLGMTQFDSWAASFGETQTAIELAPEGVGYRTKRRFSRFFNLPELISVFKEAADIKTADMLNLPVPEAQYENVVLKPSEYQKEMVASLANRAEAVRNQLVSPYQDNMLRITNDGRKLALDQRLINEMLPANENSKVAVCAEKSYHIWEETTSERSTQLIFCDLSTPRKNRDESFSVYDELKSLLMKKGVPEDEIAFIHDANTDQKKAELFAKVRSGQVRFLIGSTSKMGAGTNVQDRFSVSLLSMCRHLLPLRITL